MNKCLISCLSAIISLFTCNALYAADDELKTEEEKTFYYMGSMLGGNLKQLNLTDEQLETVLRGIRESVKGTAIQLDDATYQAKLQELAQQQMSAAAEVEKIESTKFLEKMAAEEGAITTESGIVIRELVAGTGKTPAVDSVVKAHYHGTLRDGTVFDSSVERGEPFTAPLNNVIPCWQEAITMMKEGGKSDVTCPAAVAYGDRAAGKIPAGAALNFQVELIAVVE
jgi:FKBP-type peptidyl-prolyl cis-trans isomerase FkpA